MGEVLQFPQQNEALLDPISALEEMNEQELSDLQMLADANGDSLEEAAKKLIAGTLERELGI